MRKLMSAGHKKKAEKKGKTAPVVKDEAPRAARTEEKAEAKKALIVPIDFTGFEELKRQIEVRAVDDLRPFEMECIWLLKRAVILPLGDR